MTKERLLELKEYLKNVGSLNNNFGDNSRLYSMTTENIYGFLKKFDLKNKDVLTVASSGDQRLNSFLLGANNVTCFDINPLAKLNMILKDEVIKNLEFNEFLEFYSITTENNICSLLDNKLFNKISNKLDENTYDFFDFVINEINGYNIFFESCNDLQTLEKMNCYLNKEDYLKLRKIIKNKEISFIESNISTLPEKIKDKKFDFILLSNISDYIHRFFINEDLLSYCNIINELKNNLNKDGIMEVGYIYSYYDKGEDISDFHINEIRKKYFDSLNYYSLFVDSYYNDGSYDKIITYRRDL